MLMRLGNIRILTFSDENEVVCDGWIFLAGVLCGLKVVLKEVVAFFVCRVLRFCSPADAVAFFLLNS